jgi:hypothetical protein
VAALQNGQTRIKSILDASRTAANKVVGSVGSEEQKRRLAEQKEYSKLKSGLPPAGPGSVATGQTDQTGPNSGAAGISSSTPSGTNDSGTFRNNASFATQEKSYGTNWIYPETMNREQDHMVIHCFNYKVADVFAGSKDLTKLDTGSILNGKSISSRSFTEKELLGTVVLPMPNNLSEANQTGWGEDSLSNLTAGIMAGATGTVSLAAGGDLFGAMSATANATKDIFGSNAGAKTQIQQQLTLAAAAAAVKKLGINVNAEAYRARVTGTVINPNLELLFNGPKLRAFQFSFKMSARSAQEAKKIRGIIKFFKKAMAPKRSGQKEDGFFLGAPDVFRLKFIHKGKPSIALPMLKTCALINCNVNYTADGAYSAFELDGQPVSVQLDLSFAELTPIYNDNYGEEDSVGFAGGDAGIDNLDDPRFDPNDPSEQQNNANRNQQSSPGPSRGGASAVTAPSTRVFQPGGSTAVPGLDFDPNRPGNEPILGPGGVRGV